VGGQEAAVTVRELSKTGAIIVTQARDEIKIGGLGASRKRVEDNRFIRGKGNYVDDIVLPGMLHMEILRSPLAHARIVSIDTSKAWAIPGVRLVLTGEMMATRNLAWMPTLSYDTQAVLATDKVRFQGQEVACVIADDPYIAKDACEAIVVDYEALPVIVNPTQALAEGAPLIRDDKENQHDNVVYNWEVGDKEGTDRAFAQADLVSKLELHYPRSHPSPIECCGSIADFNRATSKLTVYMTTQAPHIIRAAVALVAELPEHMIRIVSPDLGGGFGNKVPVYPGYVMSILASILLERPVKWIEDKTGNLISTGFGRDIYLRGELALRKDGKILGVRMHTDADHGAFFSDAQPSKFKIGLMHSTFSCYDVPAAHLTARGTYTNKAPGGVAYRCSFRVTEAMFFQERMVQAAADDLGIDQAEFRRRNFVRDDDFPHRTPFGFLTDSGQYAKCLDVGLEAIGYQDFLKQKEEAKKRGRLLGIGISTMTEPLGAGNSREYDILGIKMFDSAELRVHMTGKAILRTGAKTQGQGHETTWAQIVAHELGIPAEDVVVEEGDTDTAPFGMGTYASRSTPVAGAAVAMVSRKVRAKARKLAAHLLEVSEEDVEWELGRFYVRSSPERGVSIQECAAAAYSNMPDGMEPGLENVAYYDPPNLTWPFGCYIATVEVDPQTGVWDVLRVVAVDDCGVRINPMIVEGQIMGGLTEAYAMANMQFITFDAQGNCVGSNYMDYLLPTAWETPGYELHEVVTPSPHHPIGAKGVGECATVGGPAAFVNAVLDAIKDSGVRNIDMPLLPDRVYEALTQRHDVSGAPPVRSDD
jgi:carbon-monoxide dehydrogenase large subunit